MGVFLLKIGYFALLFLSSYIVSYSNEFTIHKIFNNEPKVIVVNGYSTSFHWPELLQKKIDRFHGEGIIKVEKATKGGTPIAKWIDVDTGQPKKPWIDIVRPALNKHKDLPIIVLGQQSLQWVFGERNKGINNENDYERIQQGANAIEHYVKRMIHEGADLVIVAMHIYKHPMEPEIGNERLALKEALARDVERFLAGPDVWTPTQKLYPTAFAKDKVHPGSVGEEIMAQLWFETLLEYDGIEVPEWSREEMNQYIESEHK